MLIRYLFDPLCGWCYGAAPAVEALAADGDRGLEMLPIGLFPPGAVTVTPEWAASIWAHDQRIAHTTGQPFSPAYRDRVLGRTDAPVDSTVPIRALVHLGLNGASELEWLWRLQRARYVDGVDTSDPHALARLIAPACDDTDFDRLADTLASDPDLRRAAADRVADAQRAMRRSRVNGVPALIASVGDETYLLQGSILYGSPRRLIDTVNGLAQA